jgi:hypothetical protein
VPPGPGGLAQRAGRARRRGLAERRGASAWRNPGRSPGPPC